MCNREFWEGCWGGLPKPKAEPEIQGFNSAAIEALKKCNVGFGNRMV